MIKRSILYLALLILLLSLIPGAACSLAGNFSTSPPPTASATENSTPVETAPPAIPTATANITPINPTWTATPQENQTAALPGIADVVAMVKPAVVSVKVEITAYDFFNRPFLQEAAGSGWIIDPDGIIVTNNHVVADAVNISVTLDDGRTLAADIDTVATDVLTDLAVLKVDAKDLPSLKIGDSTKMRVGDWVVAIGNSLGEGIRATLGIVSRRDISQQVGDGQTLYGLIETDAAINPGNSGGPLVNMAGEVIGITSAKLAAVEIEGVGYAISTSEATPVIQQLINKGYVVRPWLGVLLYTVDPFAISRLGLAVEEGVIITEVVPGSPASNAGLKAGDVITEFAGQKITDVNELIRAIHSARVGQSVEITYWRGQDKNTTRAILAESSPPPK